MYARRVDNRTLRFGVSGKLIRNSLVMFDRETGTLWSHLTGEAIEGPLKGRTLEIVISDRTSWGVWRQRHPSTEILRTDSFEDPYRGYYAGSDTGVTSTRHNDGRLGAKEKVIGVRLAGAVKAYAFSALARQRVVDDEVGGVPIVIIFDGATESGAVYRRDPGGTLLTFSAGAGALLMRDAETSSTWDGIAGRATDGKLAGTSLEQVPITYSFWFGWADFYPQTTVYR